MSKTQSESKRLLKVSFSIAIIIFFTAVLSDFSVRMFYSSEVFWVKVLSGLLAVVIITLTIWVLLMWMPELREPFLHIFGKD